MFLRTHDIILTVRLEGRNGLDQPIHSCDIDLLITSTEVDLNLSFFFDNRSESLRPQLKQQGDPLTIGGNRKLPRSRN